MVMRFQSPLVYLFYQYVLDNPHERKGLDIKQSFALSTTLNTEKWLNLFSVCGKLEKCLFDTNFTCIF